MGEETAGREKVRIKALTLLHDLMLEMDGLGDLVREAGICQVWDKVLVVPRTDRAAKREDHLSAIGDQWPLRQEHDIIGKVLEALARVAKPCRTELTASSELKAKLVFSEVAATLDI